MYFQNQILGTICNLNQSPPAPAIEIWWGFFIGIYEYACVYVRANITRSFRLFVVSQN